MGQLQQPAPVVGQVSLLMKHTTTPPPCLLPGAGQQPGLRADPVVLPQWRQQLPHMCAAGQAGGGRGDTRAGWLPQPPLQHTLPASKPGEIIPGLVHSLPVVCAWPASRQVGGVCCCKLIGTCLAGAGAALQGHRRSAWGSILTWSSAAGPTWAGSSTSTARQVRPGVVGGGGWGGLTPGAYWWLQS
jgi:hypothetical protein